MKKRQREISQWKNLLTHVLVLLFECGLITKLPLKLQHSASLSGYTSFQAHLKQKKVGYRLDFEATDKLKIHRILTEKTIENNRAFALIFVASDTLETIIECIKELRTDFRNCHMPIFSFKYLLYGEGLVNNNQQGRLVINFQGGQILKGILHCKQEPTFFLNPIFIPNPSKGT